MVQLTLTQFFASIIVILGSYLGFWMNTNVRLKALELRVDMHQKIIEKIDELKESIQELKLDLKDKVERH
jgi:hypothetical protein